MGLPNPKTRKPTASEVVEWALYIAKNKIAIDVPGSGMGAQCWDLPNYLLDKYWGLEHGEMLMLWLKNPIIEVEISR